MHQVAVGTPLLGLPPEAIRYISMSGCSTIEGIDDRTEFDAVRTAALPLVATAMHSPITSVLLYSPTPTPSPSS